MFQSPSIRLYTSENAESVVQRKAGKNLARKPFVDRSVNSKTPDPTKLQKPKLNLPKNSATAEKPKASTKLNEDLNAEDYSYSFKDVEESYEDIWPRQHFGTENLVKVLRNYCSVGDTPPPSPELAPIEINPIFFELPDLETPNFLFEEEPLHKTMDIDLPCLDDELDISL